MAAVDKLRSGLIEKILTINNLDLLKALDTLISHGSEDPEPMALTAEQKTMLEMSMEDISAGRLISQEAMMKRNMEWLRGE